MEIFISRKKDIGFLRKNTILREVIAAKVVVGTAPMVLISKKVVDLYFFRHDF